MKPELNWNMVGSFGTLEAQLDIVFSFPYVETRIVKDKPRILNGSSMIADKAIQKFLRRSYSEVRWTYGDNNGDFAIKLSFSHKARQKSFDDILKFTYDFDTFIRTQTNALINPR